MKIYLQEPQDDPYAGYDRVLAHLRSRDREKKRLGKEEHKKYWQSGEAISDYLEYGCRM